MIKRVMAACLPVLVLVVATGCAASNDGDGVASVAASGSAAPTATPSLSVVEQGRRHARCMRAHGIPEADPRVRPNGDVSLGGGYDKQLVDPSVLGKAIQACRQYQPVYSGSVQRGKLAGALQFSRCMRARGVKDFPDPDPSFLLQNVPASVQDEPHYLPARKFCETPVSQRPSPGASS